MYNQPEVTQMQTVFQMDPSVVQTLQSTKEHIHGLCNQYLQRPVRVQTIHGHTYDGVIVDTDGFHLYLQMMPTHVRGFFNPFFGGGGFNNVILPLVLYELLVISLL
ncbi:hypothetical protein [Paenibacillus sp. UNC451MF]|uniref:hypothetical protein n=1 Tax=Paenibacillus sp. UNC451MF TaxID=1449063 RepID=UPI00048D43DA|nr:hypothetical protein [Paenibacillus sp. UNC451MF]